VSGEIEGSAVASAKRTPAIARWVVGALALVVGGGVLGWAASTVLTPAEDVLDSTSFTYVEVMEGEVGSSINLNTVAEWAPIPVAANLASGTVTTVNIEPGQEVGAGTVLYTVNLRPVVIAQGSIPAFQPMQRGSSGTDVAQLQAFLASLGLYGGPADGGFGGGTEAAVEQWQENMGLEPTGMVQAGDILFVPTLPTRIALDTELVKRGATISPGAEVVQGLPATPTFTVPVTDSQAALMPIGTRVEITGPAGDLWEAFVEDQEPSDEVGVTVLLGGKEGANICGEACGTIPVAEEALLRSQIVTVEPVVGLTVPSAALSTTGEGSIFVTDEEGERHTVTVLTSARGVSIIEGVPEGMRLRVPASDDG
jgi:hypothetical protein